jgi:hypothetical protein
MVHGHERNRTVETPGGKFTKREIFCVEHGWFDLFLVGGADRWQARHEGCNPLPQNNPEGEKPEAVRLAA